MRFLTLITATLLAVPVVNIHAADTTLKLSEPNARINYSLGYQVGTDFKRQNVEINAQAIVQGIEDALSGAKPLMEPQEIQATLIELKRKVTADQRAKMREAETGKIAAGKKFMDENAKKPGVITTATGLQYTIVAPGKGMNPSPTDTVTVNYRGTLINGNEFDSSYERGEPATFPLNSA